MFSLEDSYWWFVGRRAIISRVLERLPPAERRRRLLDLGCGTGANLSLLERHGELCGLDASSEALRYAASRDASRRLVEGIANRMPFRDATFDVITALDVIEHLQADHGALLEVGRLLRPNGRLIATVPAFQWLWSEHDEALGHYRRYTKASLIRTLRGAGLQPLMVTFAICLPLFPTALFRLFQKLLRSRERHAKTAHILLPGAVNRALIGYLELEAALIHRVRLPFGVSLVAVASPASDDRA